MLLVLTAASFFAYNGQDLPDYDDAAITYRYAENLASGNGFVYNVGERVLGTTTPLFTLLLALGIKLGTKVHLVSAIFSFLSLAASVLLLYRKSNLPGKFFVLFLLNVQIMIGATCGMECGLYFLIALAVFLLWQGKHYLWSGLAGGLAMLTRPDGILVIIALLAASFWSVKKGISGKPLLLLLLGFSIVAAPWLVFSWRYFGDILPMSFYAKVHGGVNVDILWSLIYKSFYLVPFFIMGFYSMMKKAKQGCYEIRFYLAVWFVLYALAFILMNLTERMVWYVYPLEMIYVLFSLDGLQMAGRAIGHRKIRPVWLFVPFIAVALSFYGYGLYTYHRWLNGKETAKIEAGVWLSQNTPQNAVVACHTSLGQVGYYSRRKMVDNAGLINPKYDFETLIKTYQPDYIKSQKVLSFSGYILVYCQPIKGFDDYMMIYQRI
ncbi:hypothetical protein HZA73_08760 [candidate division TA06 bacterium]|nr:hypothetical protein [candidate division TA06 bacterium]